MATSVEELWREEWGVRSSASAEYYNRHVLGNIGNDWSDFGYPRYFGQGGPFLLSMYLYVFPPSPLHRPGNVGCLAAAWLLVALCLIRGVKTSGKVLGRVTW